MNTADKIVISIPLKNIWTDESELPAKRMAHLTSADIVQLLKESAVRFVVADVGHKLQWIDTNRCFDFWKQEAKHYIADSITGHYAYIASHWVIQGEVPIIMLEKFH